MNAMASPISSPGDFDFLTAKQAVVLEHLANNRTSKEIAYLLSVSETAINRRIEVMRWRLGGVTRHELARRYRQWESERERSAPRSAENQESPCVETRVEILQLAETGRDGESPDRDSEASDAVFQDSIAMAIGAPWKAQSEPRIVPRVLDGDNATLTRGAVIAVLLFAIIASLVLGLAAATALADAVS